MSKKIIIFDADKNFIGNSNPMRNSVISLWNLMSLEQKHRVYGKVYNSYRQIYEDLFHNQLEPGLSDNNILKRLRTRLNYKAPFIIASGNFIKKNKLINALFENMTADQQFIVEGKTYSSWRDLYLDLFSTDDLPNIQEKSTIHKLKQKIIEPKRLDDSTFSVLLENFGQGTSIQGTTQEGTSQEGTTQEGTSIQETTLQNINHGGTCKKKIQRRQTRRHNK